MTREIVGPNDNEGEIELCPDCGVIQNVHGLCEDCARLASNRNGTDEGGNYE